MRATPPAARDTDRDTDEDETMAKPPPSPPNSDIDGVDKDRKSVQHPDNLKGDPGRKLKTAQEQSKGRPRREG